MINHEQHAKNLIDINKTLKKLNIKTWLQDGTLLGLIRNGKLIEWDNDSDMGCHEKNWTKEAEEELKNLGFKMNFRNKIGPRFSRQGSATDIFLYRNESPDVWSWSAKKGNVEYRFDMPVFDVIEKEFWGEHFLIPENPEKWLEIKYGQNWRTPVKKWNYATDPANSRKVGR